MEAEETIYIMPKLNRLPGETYEQFLARTAKGAVKIVSVAPAEKPAKTEAKDE